MLEHCPADPGDQRVHDQIQVGGIYVGSWCCLIAVDGDYVLGWQWCATEKKAACAALLERFPVPRIVITDGGGGILRLCPSAGPKPRRSAIWSMSHATCART